MKLLQFFVVGNESAIRNFFFSLFSIDFWLVTGIWTTVSIHPWTRFWSTFIMFWKPPTTNFHPPPCSKHDTVVVVSNDGCIKIYKALCFKELYFDLGYIQKTSRAPNFGNTFIHPVSVWPIPRAINLRVMRDCLKTAFAGLEGIISPALTG